MAGVLKYGLKSTGKKGTNSGPSVSSKQDDAPKPEEKIETVKGKNSNYVTHIQETHQASK